MPSITASATDTIEMLELHDEMSLVTCEYPQTHDVTRTLPPDTWYAGQRDHTGEGDSHADIHYPDVVPHPVLDGLDKHDDGHNGPGDHQLTHQDGVNLLQKASANGLKENRGQKLIPKQL